MKMFQNFIEVLNKFIEDPLLESLQNAWAFTMFHDESMDRSHHSQAAMYCTFKHRGVVGEHFLGIFNMQFQMGLTAADLFEGITKICDEKKVDIKKCMFTETDGCATNEGSKKGLRLHFSYQNPLHIHETCNRDDIKLKLSF